MPHGCSPRSLRLHHAARRRLPRLMKKHGGKCYWCGSVVVMVRSIPVERLLSRSSNHVRYLTDHGTERQHVATVDHLTEISNGGDNQPDNLVLSCGSCNTKRSRLPPKLFTECKKCGATKEPTFDKLCSDCRDYFTELWCVLRFRKPSSGFVEWYLREHGISG